MYTPEFTHLLFCFANQMWVVLSEDVFREVPCRFCLELSLLPPSVQHLHLLNSGRMLFTTSVPSIYQALDSYCRLSTRRSKYRFSCKSSSLAVCLSHCFSYFPVTRTQFDAFHDARDQVILVTFRAESVPFVHPVLFPCPIAHCRIP